MLQAPYFGVCSLQSDERSALSWDREIDAVLIGCNEMLVMGEQQGWACQGDNKCHPVAVCSPESLGAACWYEMGVKMRFYCSTPGCDGALG